MSFDIAVEKRLGALHLSLAFRNDAPIVALFGPSGAGKTTILDMVSGVLPPDSGHVRVGSVTLFDSGAGIDLPVERRRVGYIFQDGRLFPHLSVRRNLFYGWNLTPPAERRIAPERVLGFLGIDHLMDRMPNTLSGGEAQRVAIGRALLASPRFFLMDEPLSSLDGARKEDMLGLIHDLAGEFGLPILYVSHDRAEIARLTDQVVTLNPS
ncbi:MAG TPA: ATP-binding cassette domain-containing protein [Sphingomonadales bacterium]